MTEASVRSTLVKKLRQYKDWTVLRHEDHYTSGIPDISVTGNQITSWWECKLRRKKEALSTKGIQQFTLEQLAKHGYAYYIVFYEDPAQILIYDPKDFPNGQNLGTWELNYDWVVQEIREIHRL